MFRESGKIQKLRSAKYGAEKEQACCVAKNCETFVVNGT
jgi:hypothetical protein